MTIKRRALIARWRKQRNKPAAGEFNLLELPKPNEKLRRFIHWPILAALILVHGALLVYLTGVLRLPHQQAWKTAPKIIPIELASSEMSKALAKGDRQEIRSHGTHNTHSTRSMRLANRKIQADSAKALNEEIKTSLTIKVLPVYSGTLPEDSALKSVTKSAPVMVIKTDRMPEDQRPTPIAAAQTEVREIAERTRVPPARPEQHIFQKYLDRSNKIWPEDMAFSSRSETLQAAPQTYASLQDEEPVQDTALPNMPSMPLAPLPQKRALVIDEIERDEVANLSASRMSGRGGRSSSAANLLNAYRAKVRAHLAGHKPNGGFGEGLVVVRFTLSPSGKVMAARIIRSSGTESLDDSVLDAVHWSEPYPEAPESVKPSQRRFSISFHFQ